jgi:hypothetical protein
MKLFYFIYKIMDDLYEHQKRAIEASNPQKNA